MGHTNNELCPIAAVLRYLAICGDWDSPLFIDQHHHPLTKSYVVCDQDQSTTDSSRLSTGPLCRPQFPDRGSDNCGPGWNRGIQAVLGWWHSADFIKYIRTPSDHPGRTPQL